MKLKFALRTFFFFCISIAFIYTANASHSFNFSDDHSLTFKGKQSQEQFGTDVTVANLNKDGHLDLIVSSPYFSSQGKSQRGKVEVFLGPIEKSTFKPDFTIIGAEANDLLGTAIDAGDINDDGIDDLLIGAYQAQQRPAYRPGAVYLFLGKNHRFLETYDFSVYQPDLSIYGPHHNSYFGSSVLAADMNRDNDIDIVAGAPLSQNTDTVATGNVYTVFWQNSFNWTPFYDLSINAPDQLISGQNASSLFGADLAVGHFDSKNGLDLMVSAYADSTNGKVENGAVYLFSNFDQRTQHRKIPTLTLHGEQNFDWFGFNLDVGNVNKDRFDDIFISSFAYKRTLKTGKLWLVFGTGLFDFKDEFNKNKLLESKHILIEGNINNYMLGNSVALNDLNRDGTLELVIAEPNISFTNQAKSQVSIFEVTDSLLSSEKLSTIHGSHHSKLISNSENDWFGQKVLVHDMNRDGRRDIIVSAPYWDNMFINDTGSVKVFFMQDAVELADEDEPPETENSYSGELNYLTRAELISKVIERFELEDNYSEFIKSCYQNLEFCFFVFSSQSKFDDIAFEPKITLYPDVDSDHPYYEDINIATMLGLIHGNINEAQSPFRPDMQSSRIQALKMIHEAAALERSNFFANIIKDMGGEESLSQFKDIYTDVTKDSAHMWWYPRYINFAHRIGVLPRAETFRPDDSITEAEFEELLDAFHKFAR